MAHRHTPHDNHHLRRQLARDYDTMTLETVQFWISPISYDMDAEQNRVVQQTRAGLVRMTYDAKPHVYTVRGTTGNAFREGPGGMKDLERFIPQAGRHDATYPLRFPALWPGVRWVKVNRFRPSADAGQGQHYQWYEIEMEEYPQSLLHPAIKVGGVAGAGNPFGLALPIGG